MHIKICTLQLYTQNAQYYTQFWNIAKGEKKIDMWPEIITSSILRITMSPRNAFYRSRQAKRA